MIRSFMTGPLLAALLSLSFAMGACGGDPGTAEEDPGGSGGRPSSSMGGKGGSAGGGGRAAGAGGSGSSMAGGAAGADHAGAGGSAGAAAGAAGTAAATGGAAGAATAGAGGAAGAPAMTGGAGGGIVKDPNWTSPCPGNGVACDVLAIGDDYVVGVGSAGAGYRDRVYNDAVADKRKIRFVGSQTNGSNPLSQKHEGKTGATLATIDGAVETALSTFKPHIVLVTAGMNDLKSGEAAAAVTKMTALVDKIGAANPNVLILVSLLNYTTSDTAYNAKVMAFNSGITAARSERIGKLHMEAVSFQASITGFNATSPNQYRQYLQNGAGPLLNGSGYDKVGDYVEQAMLKYLK